MFVLHDLDFAIVDMAWPACFWILSMEVWSTWVVFISRTTHRWATTGHNRCQRARQGFPHLTRQFMLAQGFFSLPAKMVYTDWAWWGKSSKIKAKKKKKIKKIPHEVNLRVRSIASPPKGGREISDVSPLSRISGLPVWSHFAISPLLFFSLVLLSLFLFTFSAFGPFPQTSIFWKVGSFLCGSCLFVFLSS